MNLDSIFRQAPFVLAVASSLVFLTASSSVNKSTTTVIVTDGDTFKINDRRFRLWGIDAPELKQMCTKQEGQYACGEGAKTVLMGIMLSGELRCEIVDTDRYQRQVARCQIDGDDVGRMMVSLGWALDYAAYSKGYYHEDESRARESKSGVWAGKFMQPWKWRKNRKSSHVKSED